ncbi:MULTISPECIES: aminoglycoside phosphotransferase family protein [Nocardioides]|uniref:Aminoglycoside phosphotransferase family protein n=1 Tax=Nocardioides vastitatis TaxID=2568655 RepID=A0ABW0ZJY3_9ACTN|nr:aminoglycoside phosphotransferase family protein [Nocardioides sp.]THJ08157.1 aminoglycoside phosphotransferase family protein [Nocardioides sp.]
MTLWSSAVWTTEEFLAELRAFVTDALGEPTSVEPVRLRPWSAVWRVQAGGRVAYAKQNCPGQAHEARLLSELAGVAPGFVVPVLAADAARDLLLTEDLGPTLQDVGRVDDVDLWCRIAAAGAWLQRLSTEAVSRVGLTVLAPGDATTYVADAVGRLSALAEGDPRRLDAHLAARLQALLPTIGRWADEVEELGLPLTLLHNDLHTSNVVANDSTLRFFDFGDAVVGDPLGNLLVPLDAVRREIGAGPDDPRLWRIADAALEVWSDLVPSSALRAALPAALQLARLARVESWRRCVATMSPAERSGYGSAPARWLGSLTEAPPVASVVAH